MNEATLRNLTDREFLNHISVATDLERMLAERLAKPDADPAEVREAYEAARKSDDEANEALEMLEEAKESLAALRDYAKSLHKALADADPGNELLDDDDKRLLNG